LKCRFCAQSLKHEFIDLNNCPPSNAYLTETQRNEPETFYPLKVLVCEACFLVQIDEYAKSSDIFNHQYAYFSSYSSSWLAHCKAYTDKIVERFNYNQDSLVVEIASNDGYLLQYFKEKNIPVLGIEPTANTAAVAIKKGIPTVVDFFGEKLATQLVKEGKKADLIAGNNVLAHVPNINDFVKGLKTLLKGENTEGGVITLEFPHLLQLIRHNQFDTIYHEHFSYLSLHTVKQIFEKQGLALFDVEEIPTHGGSLRIYAKHVSDISKKISPNIAKVLGKEVKAGLTNIETYKGFQQKANKVKNDFLGFLLKAKKDKKRIVGYGAAAKGNTLLNYCGVKKDLIDFVVDASPHKQGKFLPSSHIPIVSESEIKATKADYVVIFPWNIKDEIVEQLGYIREWGGKFVVAVPKLKVF
jgi:C-methyltransferase C-terminal domain/Putative zinc binding domain/Methyltransferase domain